MPVRKIWDHTVDGRVHAKERESISVVKKREEKCVSLLMNN